MSLIEDISRTRRRIELFCDDSNVVVEMCYIRIAPVMFALATIYNADLSVGPILIDSGYTHPQYIFKLPKASKRRLILLLDYSLPVTYPSPYFSCFFDTNPDEYRDKTSTIVQYSISNKGDNGIDISFRDDYTIQPMGTLEIKLPCYPAAFDHSDMPSLFVLRSRFAKYCKCFVSIPFLYIVNNSPNVIELGNRFVQMVLPDCQNFDRLEHNIKKLDTLQELYSMHKINNNEKQPKILLCGLFKFTYNKAYFDLPHLQLVIVCPLCNLFDFAPQPHA